MTQEEIDKGLEELIEFAPKEELTEEEFNEAKRIWESERKLSKTLRYLVSIKPGEGLIWAKTYFDLYIDNRNYNNH